MPPARVLLVDDEEAIRFGIRTFLESNGLQVEEADTCRRAEESCRAAHPDVAILDYQLPDGTALDLLPRVRAIEPDLPVAILTAYGSIDLAVQAVKQGAEQFLTKPVELPALLVLLERMLENRRSQRRQLAERASQARRPIDPFLGSSTAIQRLAEDARRVLATDSPILIQGETGTGKGVLARWLHTNGRRATEPFVDLNCAGLAREFLETELFGHEKGAFTGAVTSKLGLLELAHRGTIFLDEIGDVDLQVQPKLLKVLEEKRFRRLGSVHDRTVDVRLISASHRNLARAAQDGAFRSDLYYRIATIPLLVPALRNRPEDIPALACQLLEGIAAELGRPGIALRPEALDALRSHAWPGNIRELRNVMERAALLSGHDVLERADLRLDTPPAHTPIPAEEEETLTLAEVERRHIERALRQEQGNVARAADRLGMPKSTLYERIKRLRLSDLEVSRS